MKAGLKLIPVSLTLALAACVAAPQVDQSGSGPSPATMSGPIPKGVSEYAGARCSTPPRGSGIIVGVFSGVDDSPILSNNDGRIPVDRMRCFSTMNECRGWLYTMQSKYTNAGPATIARCTVR
ncbi:hypothetical protein ACFO1V_12810 [Daeguia caeni]|uniref:Metallophosphoesterase n=1 Tax=Daeguia caeni TaxID=439612 RepID=A0ABV9H907_9HYPH